MGFKNSIKTKLRDNLNFQLDKFDTEQEYALLKLLKLLYMNEKSPILPKVDFLSILAKPLIANQDQRLFGKESQYGKQLTELKFEIRKEVSHEFAQRVISETSNIIQTWDAKRSEARALVIRNLPVSEVVSELNRILRHLKSVLDRIEMKGETIDYEQNLFDAFYLKVHQLDYMSRIYDIQKAVAHVCESANTEHLLQTQDSRIFKTKDFVINDLESYVKDNLKMVTKMAYDREEVTKQDMFHIQSKLERVEVLRNIFNLQRKSIQPMSLSFLIAVLQEILLAERPLNTDAEAFFTNEFFKSKRNSRTIISALKNFDAERSFEDEIFEIIWVNKIERRMFAFIGRLEPYLLVEKIGFQIDRMLELLTSIPHLEVMISLHNYFIDQVFLTKKDTIHRYAKEFVGAINENTKYRCELKSERVFSLFDDRHVRDDFTSLMIRAINEEIDISSWDQGDEVYTMRYQNHVLLIEIKKSEKIFVLGRFFPIMSDVEVKLLIRNGLHKLMIS